MHLLKFYFIGNFSLLLDIRSINGLETVIQEGDEISFMPAIAGG